MRFILKKNAYVISIISKICIIIFSFLSSIMLTRYLGPNLKGQYSYLFSYIGILTLVLNLGIGQSYTFFKKSMGEEVKQDFINIYYFQLLIYILILSIINIFYRNYIFNIILLISIINQFDSQIGFMALIINVNKRNIISIVTVVFYTILLSFIYFGLDKNLNYVLIAFILKLIFDIVYVIIKNKIVPTTIFINIKLLKKIFPLGFFTMITSILIIFNYNIDIIILKKFVDYSNIGIYSVGVALAKMLWIVPDAFKDVLFNKTAKNDSIEDIKFGIKFNIYFCIAIIIAFSIFGKNFIILCYGKEFIQAYNVTLLLFLGSIPMILFKLINTLFISIGKQKFSFFVLLFSVLGNVIANFLLIPIMNIEGAALASITSYSVCGYIFLLSFMKKYNISIKEIFLFSMSEKLKIKSILKLK